MRLDRFMALALGHPEHGYYRNAQVLGRSGDFITAPEITSLFGQIIGAWLVERWQALGMPTAFDLVELGPGRGTLMADILATAQHVQPEFVAAARLWLVEIHPGLRAAQAESLGGYAPRWLESLAELPGGPPILLVANEFCDALPIRQIVRREGGWAERGVGLGEDGALRFVDLPAGTAAFLLPPDAQALSDGDVVELSPQTVALGSDLGRRLVDHGGAALIVDYGKHAPDGRPSLQAVRNHRAADPLAEPGLCDLSADVAFAALSAAIRGAGADSWGPITQANFLEECGVHQLAARALGSVAGRESGSLRMALDRLLAKDGMGTRFLVLAATSGTEGPPGGFPVS